MRLELQAKQSTANSKLGGETTKSDNRYRLRRGKLVPFGSKRASKGMPHRRIIRTIKGQGGRDYVLHATKGWRSYSEGKA